MTAIVTNAFSAGIAAAKNVLDAQTTWPDPSSALASTIFARTGTALPDFTRGSLRSTTAAQLRRSPELAAFGYVADKVDAATAKLWIEGFEYLQGRQIYPSDRQSFIFNPVEILGVTAGLNLCSGSTEQHKGWFAGTVRKGLAEGQFRTASSKQAALASLKHLKQLKAEDSASLSLDLSELAPQEILLLAGIDLAFGPIGTAIVDMERQVINHLLQGDVTIGDAVEAATLYVLLHRARDRVLLNSDSATPTERIIALGRRFPLFVERLSSRQRGRAPIQIQDEYDVQDMLHALLKLHFDNVRPEEHTPSYGGSSSRVDFFLPNERIVVEAKMTRANLGQKEVVDQLIIDATRYAQMDGVDTLICLVYDPTRRCSNPRTVETDVEKSSTRLIVRAIVCPQGL